MIFKHGFELRAIYVRDLDKSENCPTKTCVVWYDTLDNKWHPVGCFTLESDADAFVSTKLFRRADARSAQFGAIFNFHDDALSAIKYIESTIPW